MEYIQCKRCLMDTTAEDIVFDKDGFCNYCSDFLLKIKKPKLKLDMSLDELVDKIKFDGKNKPYDCIIGISGGVDSSYVLVKAVELGLRPLAIHMDGGWNSQFAIDNINNLVNKLGIDFYRYSLDSKEYLNLMKAFFDANVLDLELPADNFMLSFNYQLASMFNIKYILSGSNNATEGLIMPQNWHWFKYDKKNIKNIASKYNVNIKRLPMIGTIDYIKFEFLKKIKWVSFIDYLPEYNKFEVMNKLKKNFSFTPYPYKHYESIFTRLYQGYILPKKFNVDKRKNHLSALIVTNQISREDAIEQLKLDPYANFNFLDSDIKLFLDKMEWNNSKFIEYIATEGKSHLDFGSEKWMWMFCKKIYQSFVKVFS